jgi:hypothetical protein
MHVTPHVRSPTACQSTHCMSACLLDGSLAEPVAPLTCTACSYMWPAGPRHLHSYRTAASEGLPAPMLDWRAETSLSAVPHVSREGRSAGTTGLDTTWGNHQHAIRLWHRHVLVEVPMSFFNSKQHVPKPAAAISSPLYPMPWRLHYIPCPDSPKRQLCMATRAINLDHAPPVVETFHSLFHAPDS